MIAPGGGSAEDMEVDSGYNGDPTPEQIMDIDATETGREIRRRIAEQVHEVRRVMRPNDPLICEQLVPRDLAESTFKLPAVEKILHEFLPLEEAVNELLSPQINWAPPGYKPSDRPVRRAMARLWAIRTDGDGDCLLHSVSLSLWGLHDRTLVLRSLVVEVLQDRPSEKTLFKIWREEQRRADAAAGENASFEMEEDQVVAEWHMLVEAAKTPSAYLSSFHAFVLANALRRPILVYGDRFVRGKDGEPYAPSDVRGVYLPTLLDPDLCYKLPIAVGYTCVTVGKVGHFTALVGVDRELRHLPLVDEHGVNLPIRYGLPQATVTNPDPEGDAMDEYMTTTTFYTEERVEHRMATLRGAYMTPEADGIRRTMALMAEAAFDRLAKAQEEEIKRASQGPSEGGPHPTPTGDSLPLPLPPPPLPQPSPSGATVNKDGGTPPESNKTRVSGSSSNDDKTAKAPTGGGSGAAIRVEDKGSGAVSTEDPGAGTTNNTSGACGVAAAVEGARGAGRSGTGDQDGGATAVAGAGPNNPSSAGSPKSGSNGAGAVGDDGSVGSGKDPQSDPAASITARSAQPKEGDAKDADGEKSSAAMSPPVGSRFLSAPLGVLSAVGAWATGRGRPSVGSATSAADAAGTNTADHDDSGQADSPASTSGDWRRSSALVGDGSSELAERIATATGGSSHLLGENGAGSGRADARPPALKLEGSARDAPFQDPGDHQNKLSMSGRTPPDVVASGGKMGLESAHTSDRSAEGAAGETAVKNGKRKPVSSPAVTPDGPNPGQHFGDTDGGNIQPAAADVHGEEDWRVAGSAGSRRSEGKASSPSSQRRTTAAAAAETDSDAAAPETAGGAAISRNGDASSNGERDFAAAAQAYHATERWRASSRSAGTRRGQPHPRGNHDAPGTTTGGGRGGSNPWLEQAPTAAAGEGRARGRGEERYDPDAGARQRYSTAGGSNGTSRSDTRDALLSEDTRSGLDVGGSSRRGTSRTRGTSKPRADGGGRQLEGSAPTARYHSRTRPLPEGGRGVTASSEDDDIYRPPGAGRRVVRNGLDTVSLSNDRGEGERRRSSERSPHGAATAAAGEGGGSGSRRDGGGGHDIYRHERDAQYMRQTEPPPTSARRSGSPGTSARNKASSSLSPPELPTYSLYPRAPPSLTSADAVHGRWATRSSSSLSRGATSLARSSGSSGSLGRGAADGNWSVVGDERVSRAGATKPAEGTSCYGGANGLYTAGGTVGSTAAAAAAAYHRGDADWREREREALATSRLLSSSSASHRPRLARSNSGVGGRSSSPGPRPASASATWKSDSLRRALERPSTSFGRSRSPWATASSSSPGSSTSYLASALGAVPVRRAAHPSSASLNVPAAVARELSARGGRLTGTAGNNGNRSSRNSVRSNGSSSGGAAAAYGGQTLSSLRRSRVAQERRAMEAGAAGVREGIHAEVGASRPRTPYTPKFY